MAFHKHPTKDYQPCETSTLEPRIDLLSQCIRNPEYADPNGREGRDRMLNKQFFLAEDDVQQHKLPHMLNMDLVTSPNVELIDTQPEIQWSLRSDLLDFLIEVHGSFQCAPSTLFLANNLLDRYCSRHIVRMEYFQLIGCTAFLIAAKYREERDTVPTIRNLKSTCGLFYDEDMFLAMEWHMLVALDWMIGHPTVDDFLQVAVSDIVYDSEVMHMALYISEISRFHRVFVFKRSSDLARAALALAQDILNQYHHITEWALQYDTIIYADLSQCLHQPSPVLRRKYASSDYSSVARTLEVSLAQRRPIATYSSYNPSFTVQEPQSGVVDHIETTVEKPAYTNLPQFTALPTPPITPE